MFTQWWESTEVTDTFIEEPVEVFTAREGFTFPWKLPDGAFVAGGAFVSLILGRPIRDLDVKVRRAEDAALVVTPYQIDLAVTALTPVQVLNSFDLTVCKIAATNTTVYRHERALEDIRALVLRAAGLPLKYRRVFPYRLSKYINKGFTILPETLEGVDWRTAPQWLQELKGRNL